MVLSLLQQQLSALDTVIQSQLVSKSTNDHARFSLTGQHSIVNRFDSTHSTDSLQVSVEGLESCPLTIIAKKDVVMILRVFKEIFCCDISLC